MTVVILEDAASDMEAGRRFYESCQSSIGDTSSSRSSPTLIHLLFTLGFIISSLDFTGCCRSVFRLPFITKLNETLHMFMPFSTCAAILFGFVASCRRECSEPNDPPL
jgi:hypothetical protein